MKQSAAGERICDRPLLFWGAALLLVVLLVALLRDVLLPFVLGLILAYFLNPLATRLERAGLSRLLATTAIFAVFILFTVLFVVLVGPVVIRQASELATQMPGYLTQLRDFVVTSSEEWFGRLLPGGEAAAHEAMQNLTRQAAGQISGVITSLLSGGLALFSFVSLVLITPVVAFLMLKDWNAFVATVDNSLPRDHAPVIRVLAARIDRAIDGFIHGQVIIAFILGLFYSAALSIAGLKYGLLIGLLGGLLNIVPFLGSIAGLLLAGTLAVVQYWPSWQPILVVAGIFLFGQLVDGNFLTPKIIGEKVRLHPVWLIFALMTFGYLFGIVGMLVAIPLAAAIGVLVRFGLERYLGSDLYAGTRRGEDREGA